TPSAHAAKGVPAAVAERAHDVEVAAIVLSKISGHQVAAPEVLVEREPGVVRHVDSRRPWVRPARARDVRDVATRHASLIDDILGYFRIESAAGVAMRVAPRVADDVGAVVREAVRVSIAEGPTSEIAGIRRPVDREPRPRLVAADRL